MLYNPLKYYNMDIVCRDKITALLTSSLLMIAACAPTTLMSQNYSNAQGAEMVTAGQP